MTRDMGTLRCRAWCGESFGRNSSPTPDNIAPTPTLNESPGAPTKGADLGAAREAGGRGGAGATACETAFDDVPEASLEGGSDREKRFLMKRNMAQKGHAAPAGRGPHRLVLTRKCFTDFLTSCSAHG